MEATLVSHARAEHTATRQHCLCTPIPSGQPSARAGLCPDAVQSGQRAAAPVFLHPALQGSGLRFWPSTSTRAFIPWVHRPHLRAVAENTMKRKAKQGAEPGSLPAAPPHPSTQPKLNFPAAKSLCADDGFANLAAFSGGSAGASAAEKDGVASLPCPYIALIELIGFREQVAFRALQGRPICTPSCRGLSRAQALTPRGTGTTARSLAGKRSLSGAPPGTCSGGPSGEAAPGRERQSPGGAAGSRPAAALPPHGLRRRHLHSCGAFPPSHRRLLSFSPERPLESAG